MVGTMRKGGYFEELAAFALLVAIIERLFVLYCQRRRVGRRVFVRIGRAHKYRILAAIAEFAPVKPAAVFGGNRTVVFLDAPAHFSAQLLSQWLKIAGHLSVIGILRVQDGADIAIELARISQHILPFCIAQPCVIVGAFHAVLGDVFGTLFDNRRRNFRRRRKRIAFAHGHCS